MRRADYMNETTFMYRRSLVIFLISRVTPQKCSQVYMIAYLDTVCQIARFSYCYLLSIQMCQRIWSGPLTDERRSV